jgi:hypothetical protein
MRLGLGFGVTGVVFYLGCVLTMATVPHEAAVMFFQQPAAWHRRGTNPKNQRSPIPSRAGTDHHVCTWAGSQGC